VTAPLSLDDNSGGFHSKESTPMDPSADAALDNDQFLRQNSIPLLFQEQILGVFQEHFCLTQLVIGFA